MGGAPVFMIIIRRRKGLQANGDDSKASMSAHLEERFRENSVCPEYGYILHSVKQIRP